MAAKKSSTTDATRVDILEPNWQVARFQIEGVTPLLMNALSQFTIDSLAAKEDGKTVPKDTRTSHQKYLDSRYIFINEAVETHCIKAGAFHKAMVEVCRDMPGLNMTSGKIKFSVLGEWCELEFSHASHRTDMSGQKTGKLFLIHRVQYDDWYTSVDTTYNADQMSLEQLTNLLNHAGAAVGVGAWRPACNGQFGRFRVVDVEAIA